MTDKRPGRLADERLVDAHEIMKLFLIHRATLNAWIRAGRFPAPLNLSSAKRLWRESTILAYLDERESHPARHAAARRKKRQR